MSKRSSRREEEMDISKRRKPVDQIKVCQDLYEVLRTQKTDGGRLLCQAFIRAPSRRNCPDYYQVVTTPIDLMRMHGKLKNEEYTAVDEFMTDVSTMVDNAKAFYKRNCQEYRDAMEILELMQSHKAKLVEEDEGGDEPTSRSRDVSPSPSIRSLRSNSPSRSVRSRESPSRLSFSGGENVDKSHLEDMLASVITYADETGRVLSEPFKLLPSRQIYPEYYNVIREPIDLKMICVKLHQDRCKSLNDLEKDLALMCKNAKAFNEPSSLIYRDANTLRKYVQTKKQEVMENAMTPVSKIKTKQNAEVINSVIRLQSVASLASPTPADLGEDQSESQDEIDASNPLWRFYLAVRNYREPKSLTLIAEPFCRLPNQKYYPDYYEEIQRPMSLFMIKQRIRTGRYPSVAHMVQDFNLMFENAKIYNVEGSQIHSNACILQTFVAAVFREIEAGNPVNFERMTLQAGTPAAPVSAQKQRKRRSSSDDLDEKKPKMGRKSLEELLIRYRGKLLALYNTVNDYKDAHGRRLAEPFREKPSPDVFPLYHEVIQNPIDMKTIRERIDGDKYANMSELMGDFDLLFSNARQIYPAGSQIHTDINIMECVMKDTARRIGASTIDSPKVVREKGSTPNSSRSGKAVTSPRPKSGGLRRPESADAARLQAKLRALYDTIRDYMDARGRKLSTIFMKLPSRSEYPDYYEVIKKPIDMARIGNRLQRFEYSSLDAIVTDFGLMFDNACRYNDPESTIYKDALTLQRVLLEKKAEIQNAEENGRVPNVPAAVQELLTHLFIAVYNHQDDEGRCYSDSLAELPELIKELEPTTKPISLDIIKQRLDKGRYRRLDRFQDDIFQVFEKSRQLGRTDSQIFEDSVALQTFFISSRDDMCKRGEHFLSPALSYTERHFSLDLEDERRQKLPKEQQEDAGHKEDPKYSPMKRKEGDTELKEITVNNMTFNVGDFCYVQPTDGRVETHIMRIERIWHEKSLNQSFASGNWYYRPHETYHLATRKFLQKEVFKSIFYDTVETSRLSGKCFVMFVKDYFTKKPKGFDEENVFVCESAYLGRVRHFCKLKQWPFNNENVELEDRTSPVQPIRVPSVFVAGSEGAVEATRPKDAIEDSIDICLGDGDSIEVLDKDREDVLHEVTDGLPGCTYYEQLIFGKLSLKLGDGVYVKNAEPCRVIPTIIRIDKIWKTQDGQAFLHGCCFARPLEIEHEPYQLFHKRELFMLDKEETAPITSVMRKCAILWIKDYCIMRPTEIPESDVYVVESRLLSQHNQIQTGDSGDTAATSDTVTTTTADTAAEIHPEEADTASLGSLEVTKKLTNKRFLKVFKLSPKVLDDEVYYFRKPIVPEREASPFLAKKVDENGGFVKMETSDSHHEINIDDLLANMEFPTERLYQVNSAAACAKNKEQIVSSVPPSPATPSSAPGTTASGSSASAIANLPKVCRSKSGYILFSAEVRKRIMNENPESTFGEISRMVGQEWRNLAEDQKKDFEDRAMKIAQQKQLLDAQKNGNKPGPGQVEVACCRWRGCDYMFDTTEQLLDHLTTTGGHTTQTGENGEPQYLCLWASCVKYKKEGKQFPSMPRLLRHIKDKHISTATRYVQGSQLTNHYVPLRPPQLPSQPSMDGMGMIGGCQTPGPQGSQGSHIQTTSHQHQVVYTMSHQMANQGQPGSTPALTSTTLPDGTTVNIASGGQVGVPGGQAGVYQGQPVVVYHVHNVAGSGAANSGGAVAGGQQQSNSGAQGAVPVGMIPLSAGGAPVTIQGQAVSVPVGSSDQPMSVAGASGVAQGLGNARPDPGRIVVQASKPPEPVFVPPPDSIKVQRALHSETYLRYIESLDNAQQTTVSKFNRAVAPQPKSVRNLPNHLNPADWFAHCPEKKEDAVKALWALRQHLLQDSLQISNHMDF